MGDADSQVVVPGGAIPVATPQFAGGAAPVPGGGTPDPAAQVSEMAKKIMATLAQNSQRKQFAGTPQPIPVPGQQDPNAARQIGMNTANPHAWGKQRLMAVLATSIQNATNRKKQEKVLKAEADWTYMSSALNELYAAQAANDPKAAAAAQAKVDVVLGDDKKRKQMQEALMQDWLEPSKTKVYGDALKSVAAKTDQQAQQDQKKQQAATGLKAMFQKLMGKQQQQPQLTPEQHQQMVREIQAKAPTATTGGTSVKDELDAANAVERLARAEKELRAAPDKYDYKVIKQKDGSEIIVAADKTDPTKPYIELKSASGDTAKPGEKKYVDEGKLEVIGGLPTGRVKHGGKYINPGQDGYTKEDEKAIDLAMNAQGLSQKQKEKLVNLRAQATAADRAAFVFHNVVNKQTGEVGEVSALEMAKNPSLYGGASEQEKISARDSVHESLNTNFKALGDSLDKLPNGLDTETQVLLKKALSEDNPGLIDTLLVNEVKANASDELLQYITNIKLMQEDVMTLRSVGGMGAGSDSMRHAMVQTIPGAGTGSVREAKMQIAGAKRTSDALFSRRPQSKLPVSGGGDEKSKGDDSKSKTEIQFTPISQ